MNLITVFYFLFLAGVISLVVASLSTFLFKGEGVKSKDIFLGGSFIYRNLSKFVIEKHVSFIRLCVIFGAVFMMLASLVLVLASVA